MSGRYKMRRRYPITEGYCAECGSVKVSYGVPAFQYRVHQGTIPCAPWWHDFIRKLRAVNLRTYLYRRIRMLSNETRQEPR